MSCHYKLDVHRGYVEDMGAVQTHGILAAYYWPGP